MPTLNTHFQKKRMFCNQIDDEEIENPHGESDFDDPEAMEFKKLLEDPSVDQETKNELIKERRKEGFQPLPFSKLHGPLKNGVDDEKWTGLRFTLDWNPCQTYKMEYNITMDKPKNIQYRMNAMAILPVNNSPHQGLFLVGRKEGDQSLQLQGHFNLSRHDKFSLVVNHPKPDLNMAMYVLEYTRDFDRFTTGVKLSNQEMSVSACSTLYKNTFIGIEAVKAPRVPVLLYNYGIGLRPIHGLGIAASYIGAYSVFVFDLMYKVNPNLTTYFSLTKSDNPQAKMMGQDKEIKGTLCYNKGNTDFNVEVDYKGLMHFYVTQKITKYVGLQFNLEFNPFANKLDKKNKKVLRSYGIGIKLETKMVQDELSSIEEDISDYDYDKLVSTKF